MKMKMMKARTSKTMKRLIKNILIVLCGTGMLAVSVPVSAMAAPVEEVKVAGEFVTPENLPEGENVIFEDESLNEVPNFRIDEDGNLVLIKDAEEPEVGDTLTPTDSDSADSDEIEGTGDNQTPVESYGPLTPDGNLNLVDDYGSPTGGGKQFITMQTKSGKYYYLIIDRDDEGNETVHFLNQVDEADILAAMEEEDVAAYDEWQASIDERKAQLEAEEEALRLKKEGEAVSGNDPTPTEEPSEPVKMNQTAVYGIVGVVGLVAIYFVYTKVVKGKKKKPEVPKDEPDDDWDEEYDDEDSNTEVAEVPDEEDESVNGEDNE